MKRNHRARTAAVAGALALATAVASTTGVSMAAANQPAASVDLSTGSSQPTVSGVNPSGLFKAAIGLAQTATGLASGAVVPQIKQSDGEITIVLDPSAIPGLADAFAPAIPTQLSPIRGQDAAGRTVVFPTSGTLTSTYGMRWGAMHNGIDVANPIGTPIYSIMDGTVINSGPAQGYGNWIRVQHDDGSISVYGHMQASSLLVNVGDRVSAGQQIAAIGNEGRSTGPHLHFEIWPDGVSPADPQAWFAARGINV